MSENKLAIKRLGFLASGGNAQGMNNAIIGFVKNCLYHDIEPVLIMGGFKGLHEGNLKTYHPKQVRELEEFASRGNVIIGTSRFPQMTKLEIQKEVATQVKKHNLDGLFVIGGDGSYQGALALSKLGIKVMTLPGTIDNDVGSTEVTIGYDSALNQVNKNVSDLIDCFGSHDGVSIVEVMGRDCSDLTVSTGIGNNISHIVTRDNLIYNLEGFLEVVRQAKKNGMNCCTILVTEKMYGMNGLPNLDDIADAIEKETGHLTRFTPIGYVQRGGTTSAYDRALANLMITYAIDLFLEGKTNMAMCRHANKITAIDLQQAVGMTKKSDNKQLIEKFNKINKM